MKSLIALCLAIATTTAFDLSALTAGSSGKPMFLVLPPHMLQAMGLPRFDKSALTTPAVTSPVVTPTIPVPIPNNIVHQPVTPVVSIVPPVVQSKISISQPKPQKLVQKAIQKPVQKPAPTQANKKAQQPEQKFITKVDKSKYDSEKKNFSQTRKFQQKLGKKIIKLCRECGSYGILQV